MRALLSALLLLSSASFPIRQVPAPKTSASPPPGPIWRDEDLGLELHYSSGMTIHPEITIQNALARGAAGDERHQAARAQAARCLKTLFAAASGDDAFHEPVQRLVIVDFDRECVPAGADEERLLTTLEGMPKQFSWLTDAMTPARYDVDGHQIHLSGGSGIVADQYDDTRSTTMSLKMADFAQRKHLILIMLMSNSPEGARALAQTRLGFDGHPPALVIPEQYASGLPAAGPPNQ